MLEGGDVRLETPAGQVLASRGNARSLFPGAEGRSGGIGWIKCTSLVMPFGIILSSLRCCSEKISYGTQFPLGPLKRHFLRTYRLIVALSSFISIHRPIY